ncbi:hypothetical protein [Kitasatospora sp. NPDC088346]|uniref:hypothetical protein n=1 Tax=Kitasatospora sp. NPDC088346 TaxID=3364073 RepID=UPI0038283D22
MTVPLLDDHPGPPRIDLLLTPAGTGAGTRTTYRDGTAVWLLSGLGAHSAARIALGPGPTSSGPVVFLRVDGRLYAVDQIRGTVATARTQRLRPGTLVLVTAGRPSGPAPHVHLTRTPADAADGRHTIERGQP